MQSPTHTCLRPIPKHQNTTKTTPLFDTATRGPFQAQFWQAMRTKFNTLTKEFDCWEYVPNPGKHVLPSTWAFKIKRYPDGHVKTFKARFCAWGDKQQEGINNFETWAPVNQWSTVQIVMTLAVKLNLISIQCNITATFIHSKGSSQRENPRTSTKRFPSREWRWSTPPKKNSLRS